ncbi:MAG TPA: HEAT repeat domain-containing protein [Kofleriaceae bacterium]
MLRGIARSATILALAILVLALSAGPAHADQVSQLTRMLASSNEKTKLAAVVSLAKIGSKRALKPLVNKALKDPNAKVRTLTAAALGNTGSKATLPALKRAANGDSDPRVRRAARDSASLVAKKHNLSNPFPEAGVAQPAPATRNPFGEPPVPANQPDLFVTIKNANDDSPGTADKKARLANAEIVRGVLAQHCRSAPLVTMSASDAKRFGLPSRQIDVSVTKLDVARNGNYMELDAQLRVAISDDQGKMLSFLSGGAKVQVPAATFQSRYLPQMRKEALENAMRGMVTKLLAHLRDRSQS